MASKVMVDQYVASLLVTAALQVRLENTPRVTERELRAASPLGLVLSASLDALLSSGYFPVGDCWEVECFYDSPIRSFVAVKEFAKPSRGGAIDKVSVWVQGIITGDGLRIESFEFQ